MDKRALLEYGKSALASINTDPIYLLRTFYVTAAATTAIFDLFPALQSRFINYGARGTKVKDADGKPVDDVPKTSSTSIVKLLDLLAGFQVPHSWFIQFYIVSVLSSLFWGFQIFTKGSVFEAVAKHHYENTTHQEGFMSYAQVVLTWLLMTIQGSRRLYECITLTKPSTSKMAGPAWILGILFYVAMSISVWIEGIAPVIAHGEPGVRPPVAGLPFFKTVVGVLLFGSFSYLQNDSHRYLTSLKKYSLPERGLFKQIISPHYTAECMIYLSMALVAAPKAQVLNKTIVTALFFEIVNLGITAESTRKWYAKKFGERSIKGRWRMIPFVY